MPGRNVTYQYSLAFKQKVISEIESGKVSVGEARRIYDIKGPGTIPAWLKKFGKHHLLDKVIRIEMKDEKDKLRELEREKKQLESALAQAHLKNLCLEALIESAEEHFGVDKKKILARKRPKHCHSSEREKHENFCITDLPEFWSNSSGILQRTKKTNGAFYAAG